MTVPAMKVDISDSPLRGVTSVTAIRQKSDSLFQIHCLDFGITLYSLLCINASLVQIKIQCTF